MTNHAAQLAIIKHVTRQESRSSAGNWQADEPPGARACSGKICRRPRGTSSERVMRGPGWGSGLGRPQAAEGAVVLPEGLSEVTGQAVAWGKF